MTGPLDAEGMRRSVENLAYGSVASYLAEVPGTKQGQPVEMMRFIADEERALFQMFAIAEEAANRWDANVSVAQRLGDLIPGDTSLIIMVAGADRESALDCCRFVSDRLSNQVPIWSE
jgi:molybdopterin synthase catalytic subunit